jgi:flavin reductase (DIM6/NTAB) family NADH-FMN oxidoreductase RutF
MTADAGVFRQVMGRFATGVTVLTTGRDGAYRGMTVNAFSSVSLRPPLVLVCVARDARSHDVIGEAGAFAVNVLAEDQEALSRAFADPTSPANQSLAGVDYDVGESGLPLLRGCLAYAECRVVTSHLAGDHTIFLGAVEAARTARDAMPLIFYGGAYRALVP